MPQRKSIQEVNHILDLYNSGFSQNQIFKTLGIDRGTIRQIVNDPEGYLKKSTIEFDLSEIDKKSYAFILGAYLGDGCISKTHKPNVLRLRIALDIKYEKLNEEVIIELKKLFPNNKVNYVRVGETNGCVISLYSTNLLKLFPQHDIGKKHERPIVLEDWQRDIVDEYNVEFLKGLIYTDGSFYYSGKYEYCNFTNKSMDIMNLCSESMSKLNINHKIRKKSKDPKYYCYDIQIQNAKEMAKIPFRKS
jgi:hypothetical protein